MENKKFRAVGAGVLAAVWLGLAGFAWVGPDQEISEAERRPLEQMPQITLQTLLDGKFMEKFEDYSLDQFPFRDGFRRVKSLFHYYVLNQSDNKGIYLSNGYAAKLEYPLNETSVEYALRRFNYLYNQYLKDSGSKIFTAVVPDKGYYLTQENGYLAMDYDRLFAMVKEGMPWASYVDLTDTLDYTDYYRTDTHWRQEHLMEAATKLCQAMGVTAPKAEDYRVTALQRPFYGVYYGQAALPMDPETLYILESELISECTVLNHETQKYDGVYDWSKLTGKDLYEVFLSGPRSLLTIENPNAGTDKELIVFRDSFGSSIVPLLLQDYAKVTLVDIRYLSSSALERYVEFTGQDVLFLYSTLVLNNSSMLK